MNTITKLLYLFLEGLLNTEVYELFFKNKRDILKNKIKNSYRQYKNIK